MLHYLYIGSKSGALLTELTIVAFLKMRKTISYRLNHPYGIRKQHIYNTKISFSESFTKHYFFSMFLI